MACCGAKPIQGAYHLTFVQGDDTIDHGVKTRPLGYSVGQIGAEMVRSKQFGSWDVYVKSGHNKPEHRGVLTITAGAVDFDQRAQPLAA